MACKQTNQCYRKHNLLCQRGNYCCISWTFHYITYIALNTKCSINIPLCHINRKRALLDWLLHRSKQSSNQLTSRHFCDFTTKLYSLQCVYMLIVWYPSKFNRLHNSHPWYWNSPLYGLISSGENSAHFLQLLPFIIFHFLSTRYPSLLGGQMQYEMRSLPYTSTHDKQLESNPRNSDLESNTLSTGPHTP